jgi:2-oxoglutarate ferredoxin oxidoreductase subunit alpha
LTLADKWRNPVMILSDGIFGQMMEPVEFPRTRQPAKVEKPWATTGAVGRKPNIVNTLDIIAEQSGKEHAGACWPSMTGSRKKRLRWQEVGTEDADVILVGYGTSARVARSAMEMATQRRA